MPWRRPRTRAGSRSSGCRSSCARRRSPCSRSEATISAPTGRSTCTGAPSAPGSRSTCRATSLARRCRSAACLWAGDEGRLRAFKHALYEAFFCEGLDIATDGEIARAAASAGLDPAAAVAAAYDHGRFEQLRRSARERRGRRRRRRPDACSRRTGARTGAWAVSSACSRTSRSCRARRVDGGPRRGRCRVAAWSWESTASGAPSGSAARSRRSPAPSSRQRARRSGGTRTRPSYRRTLDHFGAALARARVRPSRRIPSARSSHATDRTGEPAFGIGSHCDSNRNGGRYDGTLGVVTALEVCRLSAERGLDLPLQLVSFLEEEGSGFGQMLLGSRIMLQRVTEDDLRERFRAIDDGRSFWEHAEAAGYEPARWRESIQVLDGLTGWIEMHIEQARVLQDTGQADRDRRRDRGLRPRRRLRHGPRRPRRRDADGPPARPDDRRSRRPCWSSSGSRPRPAAARSAPSARSSSTRA